MQAYIGDSRMHTASGDTENNRGSVKNGIATDKRTSSTQEDEGKWAVVVPSSAGQESKACDALQGTRMDMQPCTCSEASLATHYQATQQHAFPARVAKHPLVDCRLWSKGKGAPAASGLLEC